jgi:hypothetical protein
MRQAALAAGVLKEPTPIEAVRRCVARESAKLTTDAERIEMAAVLHEWTSKLRAQCKG